MSKDSTRFHKKCLWWQMFPCPLSCCSTSKDNAGSGESERLYAQNDSSPYEAAVKRRDFPSCTNGKPAVLCFLPEKKGRTGGSSTQLLQPSVPHKMMSKRHQHCHFWGLRKLLEEWGKKHLCECLIFSVLIGLDTMIMLLLLAKPVFSSGSPLPVKHVLSVRSRRWCH